MVPIVRQQPSSRPRLRRTEVDEVQLGSLVTGVAFFVLGCAAVIYFIANASH